MQTGAGRGRRRRGLAHHEPGRCGIGRRAGDRLPVRRRRPRLRADAARRQAGARGPAPGRRGGDVLELGRPVEKTGPMATVLPWGLSKKDPSIQSEASVS